MDIGKRSLQDHLSPRRTVILKATDKRTAVRELVDAICSDTDAPLDAQSVFELVWEREMSLSTRIATSIAIPHARVGSMTATLVAVGKSPAGIAWDGEPEAPVHVVILILGPEHEHLEVLGDIATRLSNEKLKQALLDAADPRDLHELLAMPYAKTAGEPKPRLRDLSIICFEHAVAMARKMDASAIVLHAEAVGDIDFVADYDLVDRVLVVITRDASRYPNYDQVDHFVTVPFQGLNRSSQVDVAFLFLVSQGIVPRSERVVSVCGIADTGILDTIMVTNLEQEYHGFVPERADGKPPGDIQPQVISRVLQVTSNLAAEGREGKPVGTIFVVGDYERVWENCRQMIINPFKGYPEDDRNILDPALEETIKEFSRIDGAFIVRGDGAIMSAGAFLRTDSLDASLAPGLGARHAAAAMISRQTRALAVALSESTRRISLYRNGQKTLEL